MFPSTKARWSFVGFPLTLLAAYTIFLLPLRFPPQVPVRSESFAAGFNNKIAEIAAGLFSILTAALYARFGQPAQPQPQEKLSRAWMWISIAAATAVTLALGTAAIHVQAYFGESQYFLTQLDAVLRLHGTLYRDVQFAYGPMLFWWPALWVRAGVPLFPAYVGALAVMQALGFALFFFVVQALPLTMNRKRLAFAALAFGALSPTLGLNYTLFRCALPMALLLWLTRQRSVQRAALAAAFCVAASFAVSSEAGVACAGGILAYAFVKVWLSGARWLGVAAGGAAGFILFALTMGPHYFHTLRAAGTGGFDLLLAPDPRTLFVLIASVALAPIAVGAWFHAARRTPSAQPQAVLIVTLYGAALGALPVALGRSDAIHEFFFSLGCVLLSIVSLGQFRRITAIAWMVCVAALALSTQRANFVLYLHPLLQLRASAPDGLDVPALEQALGGQPVSPIDGVPWRVDQALIARGLIAPGFYCQMSGVWSEADERRKIADLRRSSFALSRGEGMTDHLPFQPARHWRWLGLNYRQKRQPYVPGALIDRELADNWQYIAPFGQYILLRRIR